ncbi:MAG: hypothetical protein U5J64_11890 [Halobacteriales archaeon]|nr:hypothetical protein [Halobacteriales archaeon]
MTTPELPNIFLAVYAAVMLTVSALLVYTVVAYARNVAYVEGIVLLALAFLSVTFVLILDFFLGMATLANAVRLSGACFALAGVWFFARDFVRVGTDSGHGFDDRGGFDD